MSTICAIITGPTLFDARRQMNYASDYADMVEFRMDLWVSHRLDEVEKLSQEHPDLPVIFTLRAKADESELKRLTEIEKLATLRPAYFDIEGEVPLEIRRNIITKFNKTQWVTSLHLSGVPLEEVISMYEQHKRDFPGSYMKIALEAKTPLEAIRFCNWVYSVKDPHFVGIASGPYGQISRILSPVLGNPWIYASTENKPHPLGLISAQTLREIYRLKRTRSITSFYALIGNPVEQSPSYITHNRVLEELGESSVYIRLATDHLEEYWNELKKLPIKGASITMPYKEEIMSYLDYIDPQALKMGAVNTVLFEDERTYGFNTDGFGALNAIEAVKKVSGLSVGILGAGGAARAAIFESLERGAEVFVYNRTTRKGKKVVHELGCKEGVWEKWGDHAFWINAIPETPPITFKKDQVVLDMRIDKQDTPLLIKAREVGAIPVSGTEMFIQQACGQFFIWLKKNVDPTTLRSALQNL